MRVFLTGSTGFIGSSLVPELLAAGHQVLGLTRSEAGAQALAKAGAEAHHGDIEDLESLRSGTAGCDGVIHVAFDHHDRDCAEKDATRDDPPKPRPAPPSRHAAALTQPARSGKRGRTFPVRVPE